MRSRLAFSSARERRLPGGQRKYELRTLAFHPAGVSESPRMNPMSQSKVTLLAHSSKPDGRAFGLRVWLWAHSVWWQVAWFWSQSPPHEWLSRPQALSDHCIVRFSGGLL